MQPVTVYKWVDYSSKYGLGYILSDGTPGVVLSDNLKCFLTQNGSTFRVIDAQQDELVDTPES